MKIKFIGLIGIMITLGLNLCYSFEPQDPNASVLPPADGSQESRIYPFLKDPLEDPSPIIKETYTLQIIDSKTGKVMATKKVIAIDTDGDGNPESIEEIDEDGSNKE